MKWYGTRNYGQKGNTWSKNAFFCFWSRDMGVVRWRHKLNHTCPQWMLSKFGPMKAYMCWVTANSFFPSNGLKRYCNGPLTYEITSFLDPRKLRSVFLIWKRPRMYFGIVSNWIVYWVSKREKWSGVWPEEAGAGYEKKKRGTRARGKLKQQKGKRT